MGGRKAGERGQGLSWDCGDAEGVEGQHGQGCGWEGGRGGKKGPGGQARCLGTPGGGASLKGDAEVGEAVLRGRGLGTGWEGWTRVGLRRPVLGGICL